MSDAEPVKKQEKEYPRSYLVEIRDKIKSEIAKLGANIFDVESVELKCCHDESPFDAVVSGTYCGPEFNCLEDATSKVSDIINTAILNCGYMDLKQTKFNYTEKGELRLEQRYIIKEKEETVEMTMTVEKLFELKDKIKFAITEVGHNTFTLKDLYITWDGEKGVFRMGVKGLYHGPYRFRDNIHAIVPYEVDDVIRGSLQTLGHIIEDALTPTILERTGDGYHIYIETAYNIKKVPVEETMDKQILESAEIIKQKDAKIDDLNNLIQEKENESKEKMRNDIAEMFRCDAMIRERDAKIKQLIADMLDASLEITRLKDDCANKDVRIKELEETIERAKVAHQQNHATIDSIYIGLRESESRNKKLLRDIFDITQTNKELTKENEQLKKELLTQHTEKEEDLELVIDALKRDLAGKVANIQQLNEDVYNFERGMNELKSQVEHRDRKIYHLECAIKTLQEGGDGLKLADLRKQVIETNVLLQERLKENIKSKEEIETLKREVRAFLEELNQYIQGIVSLISLFVFDQVVFKAVTAELQTKIELMRGRCECEQRCCPEDGDEDDEELDD